MEGSGGKSLEAAVVDADGQVAGRLASKVAKMLLDGRRVVVVSAEKALLTGKRKSVFDEWMRKLEISSAVHPKFGPFHPRTPSGILSRMVRGMVHRRKAMGVEAFKRLRVYVGVPERYSSSCKTGFDDAKATKPLSYYVTLGELARQLGWKGE